MEQLLENLKRHLDELSVKIMTRHCGSEGERLAAAYIEKVFNSYGYETVREDFPVLGWDFKDFELVNLTQGRAVPDATACFFSNTVEAEGKLLWLGQKELAKLDAQPVEGRICFLEFWNGSDGVFGRNEFAERLDAMGAAAAIFISNIHVDWTPSTKIERSPFLKKLGVAAVSQRGAYDIADHPDDVYRIRIHATNFPTTSSNVIARVNAGPEAPRAVVGAHYDTAPLVAGAGDNASGVAVLLELARLVKDKFPGWSIDFVAFGAEEYIPKDFPPGSNDYVLRHKEENIRWLLNMDDCGQKLGYRGFAISHQDKLPKLNLPYPMDEEPGGGDDKAFMHAGIPTVWLCTHQPFCQVHTTLDTVKTLNFTRMAEMTLEFEDLFLQLLH